MDFFDKLGKKMGDVYQGAKAKTEEVSQEFKIRTKITEKKMESQTCIIKDPGKKIQKASLRPP